MAQSNLIKELVLRYFKENPVGSSSEDAFAPWWLAKAFSLSPSDANRQVAEDGAREGRLDGFHWSEGPGGPTLHLVMARMTEARGAIKKAITEMESLLPELAPLLKGKAPETSGKNTVLTRLAAVLSNNEKALKQVSLDFHIVHLNPEPREILLTSMSASMEAFFRAAKKILGGHRVKLSLRGPGDIDPSVAVAHVPATEQTMEFSGVRLSASDGVQYHVGIGRLADLVRLYEEYGDQLFAKNVRAFLYKGIERGPGRHMRETLRQICKKGVPKAERVRPQDFAIFHNGITLHVVSASVKDDNVTVREPSVLNGCQTVKNAWLFRHELEKELDERAWEEISVPVRIIVSADEDLVRTVTVSNNRQSAIRPSAFRANDPIQLELGERLRLAGVFYERQEGAFDNLRRSDPRRLEEVYRNSPDAPLTMEELALAIAAVSNQPALSVASKLSDLFEDAQYERVFSPGRLKNLETLIFIRNVFRITHLALKDVRAEVQRLADLKTTAFVFPVMRAMARYLLKEKPELRAEYGAKVEARLGTAHPLRAEMRKAIAKSGLQTLLYETWYDKESARWISATDKDAIETVLKKLGVSDFSVF